MEALGDRPVVPVVLAGGYSPQVFAGFLARVFLGAESLRATQREVVHGARGGLGSAQFPHRVGQLGVECDLDTGLGGGHGGSVPRGWYKTGMLGKPRRGSRPALRDVRSGRSLNAFALG